MADSIYVVECEECGETVDKDDTYECSCGKTICNHCTCSVCGE